MSAAAAGHSQLISSSWVNQSSDISGGDLSASDISNQRSIRGLSLGLRGTCMNPSALAYTSGQQESTGSGAELFVLCSLIPTASDARNYWPSSAFATRHCKPHSNMESIAFRAWFHNEFHGTWLALQDITTFTFSRLLFFPYMPHAYTR